MMSTTKPVESKKRKKAVYKDSDVDQPTAKRAKPAEVEAEIPDLRSDERLVEEIPNIEPIAPPLKNNEQIPKKKKQRQMARLKPATLTEIEKSDESPLLLILFGLIRKCRKEKRESKRTSTISMKTTRMEHSTHSSYFKIEISTSAELCQDDVDRLAKLLSSNLNQTTFACLDQTIQIRTADQLHGTQKEWIIFKETLSSKWQAKQTRSSSEPIKTDLISSITFFLHGDVYGEFFTIEPVLEECFLFNPYITFNYQLDTQPIVDLNVAVAYKHAIFRPTIRANVTAYYNPEKIVDQPADKEGRHRVMVLVNCHNDAPTNRPFIEVKLVQDGIIALPTQAIVETLLNKNWNGDHGIGIELEEMVVMDVPIGYYIQTSAGEVSTISNILVVIEHNQVCKPFDTDKAIVVTPVIVTALVNALKELKESTIELVSKREMAKLQEFGVATEELAESFSSIIACSTNEVFVQKCMDSLAIDDIEALRPALQEFIETAVEKFLPRSVIPQPHAN